MANALLSSNMHEEDYALDTECPFPDNGEAVTGLLEIKRPPI
jgi:hypothetical protein